MLIIGCLGIAQARADEGTDGMPLQETQDENHHETMPTPTEVWSSWPSTASWELASDELFIEQFTVGPLELNHLSVGVQSNAQGVLFTVTNGDIYTGSLIASVAYHPETGDVAVDASFENLQLGNFLATHGGRSSARGLLSGQVRLDLPAGDHLKGQGFADIRLRDGQILTNAAIADVLLLNFLYSPGRDEGQVRMTIAEGQTTLQHAGLGNDQLAVSLRGSIGMDGSLDLRIDPELKSETMGKLPLLGQAINALIGATTKRLARLRITGTTDSPIIAVRPF
jgi:hypothetical protein